MFQKIRTFKDKIEDVYGSKLEWYTSRKTSVAKRIIHAIEADVINSEQYLENFNWLITQFDKLKYALEEADENFYNSGYDSISSSITKEMVAYAYKISKKVFEVELSRTEGRDQITNQVNMNPGSAGDYISAFYSMMEGERYTRTLNEYSTRYFLKSILKDYGEEGLRKAINASSKHVTYYAALGRGRLAYVEKMLKNIVVNIIHFNYLYTF